MNNLLFNCCQSQTLMCYCRQFVLPTARVITRLTTQNANFPSPAGGVVDYHEVVHRDK